MRDIGLMLLLLFAVTWLMLCVLRVDPQQGSACPPTKIIELPRPGKLTDPIPEAPYLKQKPTLITWYQAGWTCEDPCID